MILLVPLLVLVLLLALTLSLFHQATWAPFNGIFWAAYGKGLKYFGEDSTTGFVSSATAAGCAASVVTCPLDVVKTRMQVQASNPELFKFVGAVDCARQVLRREGGAAFFAGVGARCAWLTPRYAISITLYEKLSRSI